MNVGDDGVCGENGFVRAGDAFKAATFEKEDRLVGVSGTGAYLIQVDDPSDFEQNLIVGGGNQIVESNYYGTGMNSFTMTLSEDANSIFWQISVYSINATDTFLRATNVISMERVDTADEWTQVCSMSIICTLPVTLMRYFYNHIQHSLLFMSILPSSSTLLH